MSRQLHPIFSQVARAVTTDDVRRIYASAPNSPVCRSLLSRDEADGGGGDLAAAIAAEPVRDLRVLALIAWAYEHLAAGRITDCGDALDQAVEVAGQSPPHEMAAALAMLDGERLFHLGRLVQAARQFGAAMSLTDPATRVWGLACGHRHNALCYLEQGFSMRGDLVRLRQHWPDLAAAQSASLATLNDAVTCGRLVEAQSAFGGFGGRVTDIERLRIYAITRVLFELMASGMPDPPVADRSYGEDRRWLLEAMEEDIDGFLTTTRRLLAGDAAGALVAARAYVERIGDVAWSIIRFDFYDLVRAELACGDGEAARSVLARQQEGRGVLPLDDFFLARIARLRGDADGARRHLAAAIAHARQNAAEGRLRFELQLAVEMPPCELMRWAMAIDAAPMRQTATLDADLPAAVASLVGPSPAMADLRLPHLLHLEHHFCRKCLICLEWISASRQMRCQV